MYISCKIIYMSYNVLYYSINIIWLIFIILIAFVCTVLLSLCKFPWFLFSSIIRRLRTYDNHHNNSECQTQNRLQAKASWRMLKLIVSRECWIVFPKVYFSKSEVLVPSRNLTKKRKRKKKREKDTLLSSHIGACCLADSDGCMCGSSHLLNITLTMHRFLIPSSDLLDKLIALYPSERFWENWENFTKTKKRQQQMWNNNNNKKKKSVWICCEPLSCGCQQQQAVELLPTALTIQPVAASGTVWFSISADSFERMSSTSTLSSYSNK